jgi:hypothetical protein
VCFQGSVYFSGFLTKACEFLIFPVSATCLKLFIVIMLFPLSCCCFLSLTPKHLHREPSLLSKPDSEMHVNDFGLISCRLRDSPCQATCGADTRWMLMTHKHTVGSNESAGSCNEIQCCSCLPHKTTGGQHVTLLLSMLTVSFLKSQSS